MKTILLLGGGELGKEFTIEAKRLGQYVIVIDRYPNPPAAQVSDKSFCCDMLDGYNLSKLIKEINPDIIVPEIEAIDTNILYDFENNGIQVVPSAKAVNLTMNRDAIRNRAKELGLKTAKFDYAETLEEYKQKVKNFNYPYVVKPIMSSSGKGQTIVKDIVDEIEAWNYAINNMRGNKQKVIIEEFIAFDKEITLLTINSKDGIKFCYPITHFQKNGDYQWSYQIGDSDFIFSGMLENTQIMAKTIVEDLGGNGLFGVEFFIKDNEIYFSELSPRPHDTGMVTMISQNTNEFELHLRAILDLPINDIDVNFSNGASAVILSEIDGKYTVDGLQEALAVPSVKVRMFGKKEATIGRRLGVVLADTLDKALEASNKIKIRKV